MDYIEKATAFETYLNETENGFVREDMSGGILFTFSDADGLGYGVTFPKEGEIRAAVAVHAFGAQPDMAQELILHMFNQMNTQLVLCKAYWDENGVVWLSAPYYETGHFEPALLMQMVLTVGRQAGPFGQAVGQVMGALAPEGEGHA